MHAFLIKLRSALLVFLTHNMALPLLKLIRKPERFPYTEGDLRAFATGTLGRDLVLFLDYKGLQLLPYYARHDMKHVLLEYDATDEGEGQLQCFMLGNGHVSFPVIATVIYCFATMPEYWKPFGKAYMRGRHSPPIAHWNWVGLLTASTQELKNNINKKTSR
ncbi:MAG TPA: hypothetical protein PKC62_12825 [Ferruginibacter sp.]|nr:hypothetical protein [Chitinophagaceae bacterium]HMT97565.1 hypothetical protein [Ferruginibacter sp.]HMU24561.1 hypothetical protein [Ferruginibacter sp.]